MRIVEDTQFRSLLLKRIAEREFSNRQGTHCSDLIYCINKQALRRLLNPPLEEHEILLFSLGWATQRWLTGQDKDVPEIEVDGIIVTPDTLVNLEQTEGLNVPWELKSTFQSSDRPIEENVAWLRQIMAQCYVTGSTTAYLSRLEIMGNWRSVFGKKEEKGLPENKKPTLHAYRLEFTHSELEENWRWLGERKKLFEKVLETKNLLYRGVALAQGMDWECTYCVFNGKECPKEILVGD